jgi:urease accessory protein
MKFSRLLTLVIASTILVPELASAHVGLGDAHDALHGLIHPLTGIDHILAMVSVGLLAANLGGRAIWAVPASFVLMMVMGGIIGMNGITLPLTEWGISMSVLVLGAVIAMTVRLPVSLAMALAGTFAIFHGYAHGAEMPENASGLLFASGFVVATTLLHGLGLLLGLGIARLSNVVSQMAIKVGGGAIALVGVALVTGII